MNVTRSDKLQVIRQNVARRKRHFRYQMTHGLDRKKALRELEVWEAIERDYTPVATDLSEGT